MKIISQQHTSTVHNNNNNKMNEQTDKQKEFNYSIPSYNEMLQHH